MTGNASIEKMSKKDRLCKRCQKRPALYLSPSSGKLVARKDHDLCFRCFKDLKRQMTG